MSGGDVTVLLGPAIAVLAMLMCVARRFTTRLRLYAAQSALLVVAGPAAVPDLAAQPTFIAFALVTVLVKCALLPRFLDGIRRRHPTRRDPARSWSALVVAGAILGVAYQAATTAVPGTHPGNLAAAIAAVLLGAHVCSRTTDPMTQLLGLLVAENGVVLAIATQAPWQAATLAVIGGFEVGLALMVLLLRNPSVAATLLTDPSTRGGGGR